MKKSVKNKVPPKPPRPSTDSKFSGAASWRRVDYSPVSWRQYYAQYRDVDTDNGTFRVYMSPPPIEPEHPVIFTLHGGGYSGLTWSLFTEEITKMVDCQVVSMDVRGHGETAAKNPDDLSLETLVKDVELVIFELFRGTIPRLILVGHSMGGATAVRVAQLPSLEKYIDGLTVIDIVEGTAVESLAGMQSVLRGRPTHFRSIEHAIEWCVRSGQVRNVKSAKVSMPSQIINCETGAPATRELDTYQPLAFAEPGPTRHPALPDRIAEEDEDGAGPSAAAPAARPPADGDAAEAMKYQWRIDLSRTESHWMGWFKNLSADFLAAKAPKLLLLASIDGLDRELMVGQMQGKFQLQVLARCGHAVHEDLPDQVAKAVAGFAIRNRVTEPLPGVEFVAPGMFN